MPRRSSRSTPQRSFDRHDRRRLAALALAFLVATVTVPALTVEAGPAQDTCEEAGVPDEVCDPVGGVEEGCGEIAHDVCQALLERRLEDSDGFADDDHFGASVDVEGDVAVVGAPDADTDGNEDQGAAYVFERIGNEWVEQAKLTASDGEDGDEFGASVAVDVGNPPTVIVGAPEADRIGPDGETQEEYGAAYVFADSASEGWIEQTKLTGSIGTRCTEEDGNACPEFGKSVDVDRIAPTGRATALVAAPGSEYVHEDFGWQRDKGVVYVFEQASDGWTEQAQLTDPRSYYLTYFGSSVAFDMSPGADAAALIGQRTFTFSGGEAAQGAAWYFEEEPHGWTDQATLTASDGDAYDHLGSSVDLDRGPTGGTAALAGAPDANAAYVFSREGEAQWEEHKLTAPDGEAVDAFGTSVALDNEIGYAPFTEALDKRTAIVGAPGANAVYVYEEVGTDWGEPTRLAPFDGEWGSFGGSVDLDRETAVVGAPWTDAAYVYRPPATGG